MCAVALRSWLRRVASGGVARSGQFVECIWSRVCTYASPSAKIQDSLCYYCKYDGGRPETNTLQMMRRNIVHQSWSNADVPLTAVSNKPPRTFAIGHCRSEDSAIGGCATWIQANTCSALSNGPTLVISRKCLRNHIHTAARAPRNAMGVYELKLSKLCV